MKLSVLIPAHNEEGSIAETLLSLHSVLRKEGIPFECVVVNDHSSDRTGEILTGLQNDLPELRRIDNDGPGGFGYAVRKGLEEFQGDCVAIMMADLSDDPYDLVIFHRTMQQGYDCVFGTRWSNGGSAVDYPWPKRMVNRMANTIVRVMFRIDYNDCTNAFKLYRRGTIQGLQPFISQHFNLTLEMSLKAIVRGYSYSVVPNSWHNRKTGESKLKINEMGSGYFYIMVYCLIEKYFSRGDLRKERPKRTFL